MNKKVIISAALAGLACAGLAIGGLAYKIKYASCYDEQEKAIVYVYPNDTQRDLLNKLEESKVNTFGWGLLESVSTFKLHTGRYAIEQGMSILDVFRRLRNHQQEPVMLTVPSLRLSIAPKDKPQPMALDRLAGIMAQNIMTDSTSIAKLLADTASYASYGMTAETFPTLFLPNSYEVYWDIAPEKLMERMKKEYDNFWTSDRKQKAEAKGLTPQTATVLASIVEEETANNAEKPMVAGLYLNRLHKGMMLQADPTVKFAVGDWTLRRVLGIHLQQESPYNTYKHTGLTPGPLRIPSTAGIDAVLNAASHDYLYMCAKETFDGTHNFAVTYSEHLKNAQRYIKALNARGIR